MNVHLAVIVILLLVKRSGILSLFFAAFAFGVTVCFV